MRYSLTQRAILDHLSPRRGGFTLLELVMVIAIVVSLSGVLTLVLPDLLHKSNNARMLANIVGVDKMIQLYHDTHGGKYPDGYDSLLNASDGSTLYTALPTSSTGKIVGNYMTPQALTADQVKRLSRAGITTVYDMADPSTSTDERNATYKAGNTEKLLTTGSYLAFVTQATDGTYSLAGNKMRFVANHQYVVFGIGQKCSMVGSSGVVKEAPVIIHREGCTDPSTTYCGVVAIFDLGDPSDTSADVAAKFIGCAAVAHSYFRYSEEITHVNYDL